MGVAKRSRGRPPVFRETTPHNGRKLTKHSLIYNAEAGIRESLKTMQYSEMD
jgi:hypothetical protein